MTTETENPTTKTKRVPDFYIFENAPMVKRAASPPARDFSTKKARASRS